MINRKKSESQGPDPQSPGFPTAARLLASGGDVELKSTFTGESEVELTSTYTSPAGAHPHEAVVVVGVAADRLRAVAGDRRS